MKNTLELFIRHQCISPCVPGVYIVRYSAAKVRYVLYVPKIWLPANHILHRTA